MSQALHFAITAGLCSALVGPLGRARWTGRSPRVALVVWQTVGLSWALSVVGLAVSLALLPRNQGVVPGLAWLLQQALPELSGPQLVALAGGLLVTAGLGGGLLLGSVRVVRARRRHRQLLRLVAVGHPAAPGALVLDHPCVAAYCLPGGRSAAVVLSTGALRLLGPIEVAAVLAHERAHVRERHDLVLLPFSCLAQTFPRLRAARQALRAVSLLLEMCADDRSRKQHTPAGLAVALARFRQAGVLPGPAGSLNAAEGAHAEIETRIRRIMAPVRPLPAAVRALLVLSALTLASTPISLYFLPG